MFGRDMRTYAKALQQPIPAILMKNFSSEGSGDRRHPHAIVLLDEATDGEILFLLKIRWTLNLLPYI